MDTRFFLHLAMMSAFISCSGGRPSTINADLQNSTDSIFLSYLSCVPAESVYCIALDEMSKVLTYFSWSEKRGQSTTFKDIYFIPGSLFLPVLIGLAEMQGVLEPDNSNMDSMSSQRHLTSQIADSYEDVGPYEKHIEEWFPRAISLIPVNAPKEEKDWYSLNTFGGETMMVPATEIAAFYSAVSNGGTMILPRTHIKDVVMKKRILTDELADSLSERLQHISQLPYSTSFLGDLPFPVAGKDGIMMLSTDNEQEGPLLTSFIGTFDTFSFGPVTILVTIRLSSIGDYNSFSAARTVFKRLALAYHNPSHSSYPIQ